MIGTSIMKELILRLIFFYKRLIMNSSWYSRCHKLSYAYLQKTNFCKVTRMINSCNWKSERILKNGMKQAKNKWNHDFLKATGHANYYTYYVPGFSFRNSSSLWQNMITCHISVHVCQNMKLIKILRLGLMMRFINATKLFKMEAL